VRQRFSIGGPRNFLGASKGRNLAFLADFELCRLLAAKRLEVTT